MKHHRVTLLNLLLVVLPSVATAQDVVHDRDQAAALLSEMVGSWEIRLPNPAVEVPAVYGVRTIRMSLDDITLEWEESQESGGESRGFLGYDPVTVSYYMISVYRSPNIGVSYLRGVAQGDGREIRWEPVDIADRGLSRRQLITSIMRVDEAGSIEWRAYDDGWILNFGRL